MVKRKKSATGSSATSVHVPTPEEIQFALRPDFSDYFQHWNSAKRHAAMMAQVLPYDRMDCLPGPVLDEIAGLRNDLPVSYSLYEGGTIGMEGVQVGFESKAHKIYRPSQDGKRLLYPLMHKGLKEHMQVVWIPVFPDAIDSTNGRPFHFMSIGNLVRLLHRYEFDQGRGRPFGFVPCGGTDTKAQKLPSLNFMFPNIGVPIIGTGAQIPMDEMGDDGTNNLYMAFVASVSNLSGVYLMFDAKLMAGAFVHKVKDKDREAFTCAEQFRRGSFPDRLVIYSSATPRNNVITPDRLIFRPNMREGVKVVKLSPMTPSESLMWDAMDPTNDTIMLITFGAGNVRDKKMIERGYVEDLEGDKIGGLERTHIEILNELYHKFRYPVVLGSPMIDGCVDSPYESGAMAVSDKPEGGNAISARSATGPLLEAKMSFALAEAFGDGDRLDYKKFRAAMERDWIGEMSTTR